MGRPRKTKSGVRIDPKTGKANTGRPTVMTFEKIQKLEDGFLMGMTDREACLYAEISTGAFYNYQAENPEFVERKELLKENLKMKARMNVGAAILSGDRVISQWYLARKAKEEFAEREELTGAGGKDLGLQLSDEQFRQLVRHAKERVAGEESGEDDKPSRAKYG